MRSGLSPAKSWRRPASSPHSRLRPSGRCPSDEGVGGQPHVVEDQLELLLRCLEFHVDLRAPKSGGVARDDEEAGLEPAGPGVLGAPDDEGGVGDVDAGDEHLPPGEQPLVAVAAGGGGDAVGVGAGVGFGDAEGHGEGAVGEAGEPLLFLGVGAEAGDDGAADRRGDDHHEEGRSCRSQLFQDYGEFGHAAASAAVLLGEVDPQVAELGGFGPQFAGVGAVAYDGGHVVAPVPLSECGDGGAQVLLLFGFEGGAHGVGSSCASCTTASRAPTSTWRPGAAWSAVRVPVAGARMRCSIFIASSQMRGCPARTAAPGARPSASRTTVPGMGASRDPGSVRSVGSAKRGGW